MRLQPGKQSRVVFLADSLSRDLGRQCGQCGWNGSGRRPLKQTLLSETTKTLGPNIDSKLNYKQRTEIYAKMAYPTLVLQHRVGHYPSEPSLSLSICHTAPSFIWSTNMGTKNIMSLQLFQNKILRSIFKNCLAPPISTAEALTAIPPSDLFCQGLAVKLLFETKQ